MESTRRHRHLSRYRSDRPSLNFVLVKLTLAREALTGVSAAGMRRMMSAKEINIGPRERQMALRVRVATQGKGRTKLSAFAKPTQHIVKTGATKARRKFLSFFPGGFFDRVYIEWERDYKWRAHLEWQKYLGAAVLAERLACGDFVGIARDAIAIEARTNLLFSFEKMAVRDAVKTEAGAIAFARALYDFLHGDGMVGARFDRWCRVLGRLPRRQTRVLTWPVATVFGFIAQPKTHFFVKPNLTRKAASSYGYVLEYQSIPNAHNYAQLLAFAKCVRSDIALLRPRDMIDVQSFIWVQGSAEYED